jgi:uncharacterized protein (DUF433 family)
MIVKRPGVCGGAASIEGTRIAVADVVAQARMPNVGPDYFEDCFPHVSAAEIIEALCYYVRNEAEIDDVLRRRREMYESMVMKQRTG